MATSPTRPCPSCTDGRFALRVGTAEFGNGTTTVHLQLTASALGVDPSAIDVIQADTDAVGHDTGAFGSTGTVVAGAAVLQAAQRLAALRAARANMNGRFGGGELLTAEGSCDGTARSVAFNVHGMRVAVSSRTGEVRILYAVHAADAGTVINPMQCRGQVEGGVAQALGAAMYEHVEIDDDGVVTTRTLRNYHVPVMADIPPLEVVFADDPRRARRPAGRQADVRVTVQPGRAGARQRDPRRDRRALHDPAADP